MRLIDADALYAALKDAGMVFALHMVETAPTINPPNDPLTLGQLREMDGEPVWDTRWNVWGFLDLGLCRFFTLIGYIDINLALIYKRLYRYKLSV